MSEEKNPAPSVIARLPSAQLEVCEHGALVSPLSVCSPYLISVCMCRQELNKRQQQLELAHAMLLRHHDQTQELEYRQQKAVHAMREEHVRSMHTTELNNQEEYMRRAKRELRKKHALELKQQPKSLKVGGGRAEWGRLQCVLLTRYTKITTQ